MLFELIQDCHLLQILNSSSNLIKINRNAKSKFRVIKNNPFSSLFTIISIFLFLTKNAINCRKFNCIMDFSLLKGISRRGSFVLFWTKCIELTYFWCYLLIYIDTVIIIFLFSQKDLSSQQSQFMHSYKQKPKINKKDSKISSFLRFHLLKVLYFEKITIKEAANRFKIHYSSAKSIAREGKLKSMYRKFEELKKFQNSSLIQSQVQISSDEVKRICSDSQTLQKIESITEIEQQEKSENRQQIKKISIISTVGSNAFEVFKVFGN